MLKKYTSNKILALMNNNNDTKDKNNSETKIKKIKKTIKLKNSEEKNNSQIKNSIFNKVIIKSNSIINNNENCLLNYKNKKPIKNSPLAQKNNNNIQIKHTKKAKIKTTFSNYYTEFIFKNNNKSNFNYTDINSGVDDIEDISHIQCNNETNEESLKTNKLKYLGLYNTDSSQKINFNTYVNNEGDGKDYMLPKKPAIIISPQNKKIKKERKNILEISNKKIPKIRLGKKSNINNNNSNKDLHTNIKKNNNNNNLIKSNKTNNFIKIKKEQKNKKTNINNKENTKENFKENTIKNNDNNNNKITNKNKINDIKIDNGKHVFLSPVQKNKNSIIPKIKSSSKKMNKIKYNNYLFQYNTANSTSNKENKKIIFQRKENLKLNNSNNTNNSNKEEEKSKYILNSNININKSNLPKDKLPNLYIDTHINDLSIKNELEVNNIKTDIYKLMNEHKELSPSIVSEDKLTEKDLCLENNNNAIKKDKNLIDYFKTARKALKSMSHSLIDPINNNSIFNDNDIKNKVNECGQITNRYKEDELNNYTIKKVPIFATVNMLPQKKIKKMNYIVIIFSKHLKDNIKIREYIINFLDDKSIMNLSCVNRIFYKNIRIQFYTNIYNKIYNNNNKFIKKINDSLLRIISQKIKKNEKELDSLYDSYSTQTSYNDIILNDLYRTFPNDLKFQKNSINFNKLYNILTKYSNYNTIIGYAQGLNFLFANALYLYDNEKKAFYYIDGLIKRFELEKYLAEKNSRLTDEIKKFSNILTKHIPDIISFFDEKLINHEFFSTGWILTLFSNSMYYKNLFICWNFMIIFGWKFFYCLVIQILKYYKSIIFQTNENSLSQLMKNLLIDQKFNKDLPVIINKSLIFMQKYIVL